MKTVICVHGVGTREDKAVLEDAWEDAILESCGVKFPLERILMVYWGDIAKKWEAQAGTGLYPAKKAKKNAYGDELIVSTVQTVMNGMPKPKKKNWTSSVSTRSDALTLFEALDYPIRKAMRELANDSFLYFHIDECGKEVRFCLEEAIRVNQDSEIILIGHSLGSVIGYDVLRSHEDDFRVKHFITLGSPLGIGPVQGNLQHKEHRHFPASITGTWTNVSDPIDFVATDHEITDNFKRKGVKAIKDVSVKNPAVDGSGSRDAHNGLGYLRTAEVGNLLNKILI